MASNRPTITEEKKIEAAQEPPAAPEPVQPTGNLPAVAQPPQPGAQATPDALLIQNMNDLARVAKMVAASGLFGVRDPNQAGTLIWLALSENIPPARAFLEYYVVDGKPALKADAMLARFQRAGGTVEWHERSNERASATFRHPQGGEITVTWTLEDAKRAGLLRPTRSGKPSNWERYPRQMLKARVISEGVRTIYPAVVTGMYTPEEVGDFDDARPERPIPVEAEVVQPEPAQAGRQQDHEHPHAVEDVAPPEERQTVDDERADTELELLRRRVIMQIQAVGIDAADGLRRRLAQIILGLDDEPSFAKLDREQLEQFKTYLADLIRAANAVGINRARAGIPELVRQGRIPAPDAEGLQAMLDELEAKASSPEAPES